MSWDSKTSREQAGIRPPDRIGNQPGLAETETIRGVIAGITAEGEAVFDYRTNRAVAAEATFLTVVGITGKVGCAATRRTQRRGEPSERRASSIDTERRAQCVLRLADAEDQDLRSSEESEKPGETQAQNEARHRRKRSLSTTSRSAIMSRSSLSADEDSGSSQPAHQTEQMRRKHGRHRTHFGHATSVTILAAKDTGALRVGRGREAARSESRSNRRPVDRQSQ